MAVIMAVELSSGKQLVGETQFLESAEKFKIKNPVEIVLTQDGYGMYPYMPFTKNAEFTIPLFQVVTYGEVDSSMSAQYTNMFYQPTIIEPDKNIILPS